MKKGDKGKNHHHGIPRTTTAESAREPQPPRRRHGNLKRTNRGKRKASSQKKPQQAFASSAPRIRYPRGEAQKGMTSLSEKKASLSNYRSKNRQRIAESAPENAT